MPPDEQLHPTSPLPRALEDPLRAVRRYTGYLLFVEIIFIIAGACALLVSELEVRGANPGVSDRIKDIAPSGQSPGDLTDYDDPALSRRTEHAWWQILALASAGFALYTYAVWRVLPNRPVDVLYLRSFSRDVGTAAVRRSLQTKLGRSVRLSGIRAPRFRWPKVIRYALIYLFVMRSLTARYMNLEAGKDWKARLWRTLGDVRGVVIDVSDLTPYVVEEVLLCYRCLGLDRILFVGDATKTQEEWKQLIRGVLCIEVYSTSIRLAIWDDRQGWQEPAAGDLRGFTTYLPDKPAGLAIDARPLAQETLHDYSPGWAGWVWIELLVGVVVAFLLNWLYANQLPEDTWSQRFVFVPSLAILLFEAWAFLFYLRDCGFWRERLLAALTFGPGCVILAAVYLIGILDVPRMVREETAKLRSSNQLKMIGLALHNYAMPNGQFPEATGPGNRPLASMGRAPAVSWRVRLLPHLEDDRAAYVRRHYRRDEPWDSTHNIQFIRLMPQVYAMPGKVADARAGNTYYRVFLSRPGSRPQAAFSQGKALNLWTDFPDGGSNTILVAEAAEAVPWTKPEELLYEPERPLPQLGGHFRRGFNAVLVDGSVRFFSTDLPEEDLRAWITRDGGEPIRVK